MSEQTKDELTGLPISPAPWGTSSHGRILVDNTGLNLVEDDLFRNEADARLCKVAPKLYAALRDLVKVAVVRDCEPDNTVMRRAIDALAKARGDATPTDPKRP